MACRWEMCLRPIDVSIFQEKTQRSLWFYRFLNLPFQVWYLWILHLKLSVEKDKIWHKFWEVFISCFDFFCKRLLMVLIKLNRANDFRLWYIKQRKDKCCLRSFNRCIPVADVLLFCLALAQKDILKGVLHVLETQGYSFRFGEHLMNQIAFESYLVFLILLVQVVFNVVCWDDV